MLTVVVWACALLPALALLHFSTELLLGLRPLARLPAGSVDLDLAVIIPAHDEALLIGGTVESVRQQVAPSTRIVVVADNCSDGTAEIARRAGATVIERHDPSRRGKGFALAFARDFLASAPPEAVFILDADCRVSRGTVEAMAGHAAAVGEPVQSVNLLTAPADASPMVLVSNFAMVIKNLVRARGLYRLGGGITLFGTGMAFPWPTFAQAELATAEPVEDLRLALELARQGTKVHLWEDLSVISAAAGIEDSLDQRRRWEHGFLRNAARHGVPAIVGGLARGSRHRLALGAHLLVPPLALLFLVAGLALAPALALAIWGGNVAPAAVLGGALGLAVSLTGVAWYLLGRETLSLSALARAPLYILWKVPLYFGFFASRQTEWNRTRRVNEEN
jgi:cellulose synthase/poly-beta-1,6-N-acetylglucosamine synthase-like glycosyltransferase